MSSPNPSIPQQQQQQQSQSQQLSTTQQPQQQQHHQQIQYHRKQPSPIPSHQFRAISRNNSNTSTASSKGEFSSTISTTNSVTSNRSQLSRQHNQLIDHRQFLASCGASSTPIRSFQRATISSVVKTRAFDNNPVLQGLLTSASPSGQNSVSNSQTPSPLSTPVFSRSRSLRMSGGPSRYQQSAHHFRHTNSRTPDLFSFTNSPDVSGCHHETQAKIHELTSERSELKESLEFLECERQVLIDSAKELKETLQRERAAWKKESEELKRQLTSSLAARVKAESQLTRKDLEQSDFRIQTRAEDALAAKDKEIESLKRGLEIAQKAAKELQALNEELKKMIAEKLRFNGFQTTTGAQLNSTFEPQTSDCVSIVTELARLRLELNDKDRLIAKLGNLARRDINSSSSLNSHLSATPLKQYNDIESLNKFLDQTVECIKGWPDELAGSSHVQDLMKTLLSAYRPDRDDLCLKFDKIHL